MKAWRIGRLFRASLPASHHIRQGNAYSNERTWPRAVTAYRAALAIEPDLAHIWIQLGHALKEQGDLFNAEEAYRQATRLAAHDPDGWFQLGHLLSLAGRYRESVAALEESRRVANDPLFANEDLTSLRKLAEQPERSWRVPEWATSDILRVWNEAGFCQAALELFDPWLYWQINPEVREALGALLPLDLIRHFCTVGVLKCLHFSLVESFDPSFYRQFRLNGMSFTDENAYRHWLTSGIAQNVPANEKRWMQSLLGDHITNLNQADTLLSSAFRDERAASHTQRTLVEGYISDILTDPQRPVEPSLYNALVLHAIASRGEESSSALERQGARRLRDRLYLALPSFQDNTRALAFVLKDQKAEVAALPLLRGLVDENIEPVDTYRILSQCENHLGLRQAARKTLLTGHAAHPGEAILRFDIAAQEDEEFHQTWREAMALARIGRISEGQAAIQGFLDTLPVATCSKNIKRPQTRTIAIVAEMSLTQCTLYRVEQRRDHLEAAGFFVEIFNVHLELEDFMASVSRFDRVIFYRVPAHPKIVRAIHLTRSLGIITFYEIDDPIFDPVLYPEAFETYGGTISEDTYLGLALGVPLFLTALRLCDHAITSTKPLAERIKRYKNGLVFVQHNGIGNAHECALKRQREKIYSQDGPLTIFYGSNTKANRAEFFSILEPALINILQKYGSKIRLCIIGSLPEESVLSRLNANIILLPNFPDVQAYWSFLSAADINLAILDQSPTTDTKSGIKWLEAAMFSIPSILSDTAGYRDVASDGQTALFARETKDWVNALEKLIDDPSLRESLGRAARDHAFVTFGKLPLTSHIKKVMDEIRPQDKTAQNRILVVNVFYPPQAIGGATRVVHDNIRDLSRAENTEFVFEVFTSSAASGGEPVRVYMQDDVLVTCVMPLDVEDKDRIEEDLNMVSEFRKVVERFRPDLVHLHCIQRLTVGIIDVLLEKNIPYCITAHDAWWISDQQFVINNLGQPQLYDYHSSFLTLERCGAKAVARMEKLRKRLDGAQAVLTVSEAFAELYRACGVRHVINVSNGVSPLTPKPRNREGTGPVRLGFIGGLARHKGWDLIQIALRQGCFQNLELLAIDHAMGPREERREILGETSVLFRGKTPQSDIAELYSEIDVLLAPSIWPESFGLVTREATLCGCWVVASDRGAIGDIVEENVNGFRVDVSDSNELQRILALIDASPARFRQAAPRPEALRTARDQARDLGAFYNRILSIRRD